MLENEITQIINNSTGEREISTFLARNPNIMRWAVCRTGGHTNYVIKEFPFGSRYKADFVVPMSYSGVWEVNLIELEPHDDKVITQNGLPSSRLNKAISQINDWKEFIERNPLQFRNDLAHWCIKKDLLGFSNDGEIPSNFSGDLLNSPETFIRYNYFIVIGNRGSITTEKRRKMNQLSRDIEIFTYGRFIDLARKFDKIKLDSRASVDLRDFSE